MAMEISVSVIPDREANRFCVQMGHPRTKGLHQGWGHVNVLRDVFPPRYPGPHWTTGYDLAPERVVPGVFESTCAWMNGIQLSTG